MISALFSIPKIQDGRHIVLIMLSDLLKKTRKNEISISLLNLKCIFLAKPMESSTYLDHHYFIILNLST